MVQIRLNIRGRRSNYRWFRLKVRRPSRRDGINVSVRFPPRRNVRAAQPHRSEYIHNVIFPRQPEPDYFDLPQYEPEYIRHVIYPRQNIIFAPQTEYVPHYYPEYEGLDGWGWAYVPVDQTYELPPEPAAPVPQPAPVRDPSTFLPWEHGYVPKPSKYDPAMAPSNSYVDNYIHWKTELLKKNDKLLKNNSKFERFMGVFLRRSQMNNEEPEVPQPTQENHEPVYILIPTPDPAAPGEENVVLISPPAALRGGSFAEAPPGVETALGYPDVTVSSQSQGDPIDLTVQDTFGTTE